MPNHADCLLACLKATSFGPSLNPDATSGISAVQLSPDTGHALTGHKRDIQLSSLPGNTESSLPASQTNCYCCTCSQTVARCCWRKLQQAIPSASNWQHPHGVQHNRTRRVPQLLLRLKHWSEKVLYNWDSKGQATILQTDPSTLCHAPFSSRQLHSTTPNGPPFCTDTRRLTYSSALMVQQA